MKRLVVPSLAALALAACASGPAAAEAPAQPAAAQAQELPFMPSSLTPEAVAAADPYLWLEEVRGERALAWVEQQNARTRAVLEADPRYEQFRRDAFAILSAQDRIPTPHFQGGAIYNFWQDEAHPKGVWRRASLESYRSDAPAWETVLDIDALAAAEGKDWFWKGAECLPPEDRLCLVSLSEGGGDTVEVREFDTATGRFVEGGVRLPAGKHRFTWETADTVLVADGSSDDLTESGYPYKVQRVTRGQALADAPVVFQGAAEDGGYGVYPFTLRGSDGSLQAVMFLRPLDTFSAEHWMLVDGEPVKLELPLKSTVHALVDGQMVFTLEEPWRGFGLGALMSYDLAALKADPAAAQPALVMQPGPRQAIEGVYASRDLLLVNLYEEVTGGVEVYDFADGAWSRARRVELPANASVGVVDASSSRNDFFVNVQSFLQPVTLLLADAETGRAETVKTSPERFDASTHVVEQFQATSSDGTRIPYFVIRPRDLAMDGTAPTLLFGYGGFLVSKPPVYIPEMGKLWLENGGVFVNANIRGGNEFGPAWHQAVLKENRQKNFDDFTAVARDLIARGITTPEHLGIYGRSNGGVLTSVTMTQHPELIDAAVIESPLIDMLRYHELPAGASWIGEYGDPRIPEEAAWIARYSAYQNLRPGVEYPEVYITTNTGDDRVHPGHARKFAARLQEMGQPYLYFEDTSGGHSYDADPVANAARWARHYVYLSRRLMDD